MELNQEPSCEAILPHSVYNSEGEATIVLVHGAFQSRREWDMVISYFPENYHLLIPDMPGHGESRFVKPFSVNKAASLIARLITKCAIGGQAHVVGFSLGAHVAIEVASLYPERVKDVFVSGYELFNHSSFSQCIPYVLWIMLRCENMVPRSVIKWLMDGADLERADTSICTLSLCRAIVDAMTEAKWPSPWKSRTLIVAAGKGGLIPSNDHPGDAIKLMRIANSLTSSTVAATHPLMRHPWNRQDPWLFAQTIQAWFEKRELPDGFQYL